MKHLKKLNFVVLPLAIWVITVVYVLFTSLSARSLKTWSLLPLF